MHAIPMGFPAFRIMTLAAGSSPGTQPQTLPRLICQPLSQNRIFQMCHSGKSALMIKFRQSVRTVKVSAGTKYNSFLTQITPCVDDIIDPALCHPPGKYFLQNSIRKPLTESPISAIISLVVIRTTPPKMGL